MGLFIHREGNQDNGQEQGDDTQLNINKIKQQLNTEPKTCTEHEA